MFSWAAIEIKGTEYEPYFAPDGWPIKGWYQGWFQRMDMLTGHLRPLEQISEQWYTDENPALFALFALLENPDSTLLKMC
jgi:hypothetical protein